MFKLLHFLTLFGLVAVGGVLLAGCHPSDNSGTGAVPSAQLGAATVGAPSVASAYHPTAITCSVAHPSTVAVTFDVDQDGDGAAELQATVGPKFNFVFTLPGTVPLRCRGRDATGVGPWSVALPVDVTLTPSPLTAQVQVDAARAVTAVVGPMGGQLLAKAADGTTLSLEVPAGALPSDTTLTVTPVTSVAGTPVGSLVGAAQFGPEGLLLGVPATLRIHSAALPPSVVGVAWYGQGAEFHVTPAVTLAGEVTVAVWHFSGAGAASASSPQVAAAQGNVPTSVWDQVAQAEAAQQWQAAAQLMANYFASVLRPELQQAQATAGVAGLGYLAIPDFLHWASVVMSHGLDNYPGIVGQYLPPGQVSGPLGEGWGLTAQIIKAMFADANAKCLATKDWKSLSPVVSLWELAMNMGLDAAAGLTPAAVLADLCLKVRIDTIETPEGNTGKPLPLKVIGGYTIANGPTRYDAPVSVSLSASHAMVAPAIGLLDANGAFSATLTPSADQDVDIDVQACFVPIAELCIHKSHTVATGAEFFASGGVSGSAVPLGSATCVLDNEKAKVVFSAFKGTVAQPGRVVTLAIKPGDFGSLDKLSAITDATGTITAIFTPPGSGTVGSSAIIAALDTGETAGYTIDYGMQVDVEPKWAYVKPLGTTTFTATTKCIGNAALKWTMQGYGSLANGNYTAGKYMYGAVIRATVVGLTGPNGPVFNEGDVVVNGTGNGPGSAGFQCSYDAATDQNTCDSGLQCVGSVGMCLKAIPTGSCGKTGEPCCDGWACHWGTELSCQGGTCTGPTCGWWGKPCCGDLGCEELDMHCAADNTCAMCGYGIGTDGFNGSWNDADCCADGSCKGDPGVWYCNAANNKCTHCGTTNGPCCSDGTCGDASHAVCLGGQCLPCGEPDQPCCDPIASKTGDGCPSSDCKGGTCVACGQYGEACCSKPGLLPCQQGYCKGGSCTPCGEPPQDCCPAKGSLTSPWCSSPIFMQCMGGACEKCGHPGETCCTNIGYPYGWCENDLPVTYYCLDNTCKELPPP